MTPSSSLNDQKEEDQTTLVLTLVLALLPLLLPPTGKSISSLVSLSESIEVLSSPSPVLKILSLAFALLSVVPLVSSMASPGMELSLLLVSLNESASASLVSSSVSNESLPRKAVSVDVTPTSSLNDQEEEDQTTSALLLPQAPRSLQLPALSLVLSDESVPLAS